MPTTPGAVARLSTTARRLRGTSGALMVMAIVVGAATGLGAVAFRWLIQAATKIFTGTSDYSAVGLGQHPPHPWLPWLGAGFVVLAPVVGGLIYGPMVQRWAKEARGHGVPEVMLAVSQKGGRIPGKVAVVKALASALTIGSGGSVGREGPIVQIGSALGSRIAQTARLSETRVRTLVACGAASGIAATFNAPIAGVFFALELLLRDFQAESFGVVVLAAVVASVIGRAILGDVPFLELPSFELPHAGSFVLVALLGVLAGVIGVIFTRTLYAFEDVADKIWRGPEWARPAVGGVLLGLLLLAIPQMYGVGYPVLEAGVQGQYAIAVLLGLLIAKVVATSLTIAIGGSGGVFAPSLFIGGMLGAAFGASVHEAFPGWAGPAGAYALIGMGAVFAGAARAPITAVLILFELTGEYTIILPMMLAIVLATGVSRALSRDSVYTLKIRRRGIEMDARAADPRMTEKTVGDIMEAAPTALAPDVALEIAARRLLGSGRGSLPVVEDGMLIGQVRADRIAAAIEDEDTTALSVRDVLDDVPQARTETVLRRGMEALRRHEYPDGGLAVTDGAGTLVGWVTHRTLLRTLTAPLPIAASAPAGTALARLRPSLRGGGSRMGTSASRRQRT
ncbi:chloride channel protein [Actinotalea sp. M2MS4P-6]|uniref:chloride channel protein n=1 Tax=Actinotalea sp. M2MS4P-6 TaxID=2983762 RepID=UPI0021E4CA76|nr:chloride channel protein [Actinotalea sp. M2MS4P-6]MCV2395608.1 chloride channel protein [Actinotalea sp. M2MS4P-6]